MHPECIIMSVSGTMLGIRLITHSMAEALTRHDCSQVVQSTCRCRGWGTKWQCSTWHSIHVTRNNMTPSTRVVWCARIWGHFKMSRPTFYNRVLANIWGAFFARTARIGLVPFKQLVDFSQFSVAAGGCADSEPQAHAADGGADAEKQRWCSLMEFRNDANSTAIGHQQRRTDCLSH